MNETSRSKFKVIYSVFGDFANPAAVLGQAELIGQERVSIKFDNDKWFEMRGDDYLRDIPGVVRRLCRSVGHWSKYSMSWDENYGIGVERL